MFQHREEILQRLLFHDCRLGLMPYRLQSYVYFLIRASFLYFLFEKVFLFEKKMYLCRRF